MRSFRRVLSTCVTALAFTAAGLATATPASAGPGEGCAGLPELPAAYVCIVQLNPGALVPTVNPTPVPVRVPPVCYVAGCTAPTIVNVPLATVTPGSGNVAVLYYNGVTYPIGIGLDVVWALVSDIQILAGNVVAQVNGTIENLPSAWAIVNQLRWEVVDPIVAEQLAEIARMEEEVRYVVERLPDVIEYLLERIDDLTPTIDGDLGLPCTKYTC